MKRSTIYTEELSSIYTIACIDAIHMIERYYNDVIGSLTFVSNPKCVKLSEKIIITLIIIHRNIKINVIHKKKGDNKIINVTRLSAAVTYPFD